MSFNTKDLVSKSKTAVNTLFTKGKDIGFDLVAHWKKPGKGNFVSNKEIMNYSIGGMGKDMLIMIATYLALSVNNTLFGSVLGIRPTHIQTMNMIVLIIDILFVAIRAVVIDNTNTAWGRFRPFIVISAVPLFAITSIFMFLPFELMTYSKKLALVFCFSLGVVIIRPYFDAPFTNIGSVITPNTRERTKILAVYSIIYSLAPTVYGLIIPLFSEMTGGYTDIRTYRYIIVPIAGLGVILSMFTAFGCKERFIVPKGYKPKANLFKCTLEVFRNKYWWLRTLAIWLAFMEWCTGNMFLWSFMYGSQDMASFAIYNFFLGEAALIAMILTPFLLKKLGNRKLLVVQNILNVVFLGIIMFTFKQTFIFFIFWFLNNLVNNFNVVMKPVQSAEVNDYQHYISGKRLDGSLSFATLIGLPITIASGYFAPALMESLGITTNYDILYDPAIRNKVFTALCFFAIIGAILNLIPYIFYDYSLEKHKNVVKILRYRAMLADYASGNLTSKTLKEGLDGYYSYLEIMNASLPDLKKSKEAIKVARMLPKSTDEEKRIRKEQIKKAKKTLTHDKQLVLAKKEAKLYTKELEKYNNPKLAHIVELSRNIIAKTPEELCENAVNNLNEIKVSIAESKLEKLHKKVALKFAKKQVKMAKRVSKIFPCGIIEIDSEEYEQAENMPTTTKEEVYARYKALKAAGTKISAYNKALEFYIECKRVVVECDSRQSFEMLEGMYENACKEIEEHEKEAAIKEAAEKAAKKAEIERIKQERFDKLPPDKQAKIIARRAIRAGKKQLREEIKAAKKAEAEGIQDKEDFIEKTKENSQDAEGIQDKEDDRDTANKE